MYLSWMTICQRDPRIAVAIHVQELDAVSGGGYLNVDYIRAGGIVSLVFLVLAVGAIGCCSYERRRPTVNTRHSRVRAAHD